jgi:hypothetical protein
LELGAPKDLRIGHEKMLLLTIQKRMKIFAEGRA